MQRLLSVDLIALGNRSSPKRRRIRSLTRVYEGSYKANSSKETTGKGTVSGYIRSYEGFVTRLSVSMM